MDICFIKLQDLLALSIAICAWCFIKDKWPSRSKILNEYSEKKDEEAKKLQSQTYWWEMKPDHDPMTHQHAQAGSQKKEKDSISEPKSSMTFHKGRIFTKSTSPLTSSRAKYD
jgi:hypothetical protein